MITEFVRLTLPNQPGNAPDRLIAINPEHIAAIQDGGGPGGCCTVMLSCGEQLMVREALLVVLNMLDRRAPAITQKTKA